MTVAKAPDGATPAALDPFHSATASEIGFAWAIVELVPDGILVCDERGRIVMVNHRIEELFGYQREELVGTQLECLMSAPLRDSSERQSDDRLAVSVLRSLDLGSPLFGRHANGTDFPIEGGVSHAASDDGVAAIVVVRDVTERYARELAAQVASTLAHDERIAAELHDQVIKHLFACGLTLAGVLRDKRLDDRNTEQLRSVIDELDTAIYDIRDAVFASTVRAPVVEP